MPIQFLSVTLDGKVYSRAMIDDRLTAIVHVRGHLWTEAPPAIAWKVLSRLDYPELGA
jgi:hypothetical protein